MDSESEIKKKVSSLIASENYIGAWLLVKEARITSGLRSELTGTIVSSIAAELNRAQRPSRDRQVYLRSLLSWIFRDVPGLGLAYREQVRTSFGPSTLQSLADGLRSIGDVASGRRSLGDSAGDAAQDMRNRLEETGERIRAGEAGRVIEDVVQAAGDGLAAGLDLLGRALSDAARDQGDRGVDSGSSESPAPGRTQPGGGSGASASPDTETGRRIPVGRGAGRTGQEATDGARADPKDADDTEDAEVLDERGD